MKIAVVAGEASGDLHAADVIRELKALRPDLTSFGIGGDFLAQQGMTLLQHARTMALVGLFNVFRHLPRLRRAFNELIARIASERPDAVLLVDYPDFNLRVARKCKALGVPVIYYISPQVWAWRKGRVRHIAKYVDHMIVIFPFEEEFYRAHGVRVTYVGHPLIEQLGNVDRSAPKDDGSLRIALLPGSRKTEIDALLPAMLDAIAILQRDGAVEAFIVQARTIRREDLERVVARSDAHVTIVPHDGGQAVASADVALASSGTATLEAAVLGVPAVVMYRLSRATYALAKKLVRLEHFSLVNIVAGRRVVPELIQSEVTGVRIAEEVRKLTSPESHAAVRAELAAVRDRLGQPGASRRAAEEIVKLVS